MGKVIQIPSDPNILLSSIDDSLNVIEEEIPVKTVYGEALVSSETPFVQSTPTYGLIPANFREFTSLGGSTSVDERLFTVNTGVTPFGYGAIQSFRSLNYKSGKGASIKFSALFEDNIENSWTGVGLVNISDELSFGYNGTVFGIWHRYGGISAVRTITVTVASAGSTNLTLTLDSVAYVIPLTAGTTAHNAYQIEAWLNANQGVWVANQIDNTIIVSAQSDGAKAGTYSYVHATSTGSIATTTVGLTKTSKHIPQNEWNKDVFSNLDPSKLNLYKIVYDDNANFYVANEDTGGYKLVHVVKWLNTETRALLNNPSLRFGIYGASIGSTTDLTIKCGFVNLSLQGDLSKNRNPRAVKRTQTVTTNFINILTIRNRDTYNGFYNQIEILPIFLSIASESTKNVEIEVRANPTFSGETNFTSAGANLVSDVDFTANIVSGGTLLTGFSLGSTASKDINLKSFDITIPPGLIVSVCGRVTSGSNASLTGAFTYYEDI